MQSTSEGSLNISELANQLRREKLTIENERLIIQHLNDDIEKAFIELLKAAWICSQQRQNLTNLMTSRCEADSITACQRASLLERTTFIEAHKVFQFKEVIALGEILGWLRDSPHLISLFLLLGEDFMPPTLPSSLVSGLFGSCRTSIDRTLLLAVIRSLIKHQLATSPDPIKLFRSNKCAVAQLFAVFRDGYTPAQQFLVATLSGPVMTVLHEDEFFLDIDPDKAMERFSLSDRQKKFGVNNSPEYVAKSSRYRKWIVQSLFNLTNNFIASFKENWINFPSDLAWIVQQIVHLFKQHSSLSERELHWFCTDLVFNNFICPAIVNPEANGVVELPVSYIARSNLIQIAQIIQVLCVANIQEEEPKARDLYSKFDRSALPSLLKQLAQSTGSEPLPPAAPASPKTEPNHHAPVALFAKHDLRLLISFLKKVSSKLNNNTPSITSEEASSSFGTDAEAAVAVPVFNETGSDGSSTCSDGYTSALSALLQSIEPNYRSRMHDLLKKTPDFRKHSPQPPAEKESESHKRSLLAKVPKRLPRSGSTASGGTSHGSTDTSEDDKQEPPQVILIKIVSKEEHDYIGLLPESKVLEHYYGLSERDCLDDAASTLAVNGNSTVQKRTRFSVSHDEVSLGNTSDNLEAVSEAASNHSVSSSLELETEDQNDNLSDMVSANVSGRGSPNISGRETPSSQVTDENGAVDVANRRLPPNIPMQPTNAQKLLKQTRSDIEDKFCKFEIKKLLEGDETVSVMSDTWSTDVLASDSETIGDAEQTQIPVSQGTNSSITIAPDVSETASESAWSVNVLASDSDRNTEVDTDDCVSVAARSDSSWPRRPSHHGDNNQQQQTPKKSPVEIEPRPEPQPMTSVDSTNEHKHIVENRKSILVNGYPVMTCFAASAPESPSTSAAAPIPRDLFEFEPSSSGFASGSSATVAPLSDATMQWVDESFDRTHKRYEEDAADRSLNSSESSFNVDYDRRFEAAFEPDRQEERSAISDLMTRMSSATISTSANIVNNITSRIVKSEIRTVLITSRVERSASSVSDKSFSQEVPDSANERRVPQFSTGAIPKSISFDSTAEKTQRRRLVGEDGLVGNLDDLKNNVKRSGGNLLHKIKMFRHKGKSHANANEMKVEEERNVESSPLSRVDSMESSEDILAKYRRKSSSDSGKGRRVAQRNEQIEVDDGSDNMTDLNNPEVFNNMKRRLRTVLSYSEANCMDSVSARMKGVSLSVWLRALSASSSEESGASAEALSRALHGATNNSILALAEALRADLSARRPYLTYLANARTSLHHHFTMLNRLISTIRAESVSCSRVSASARVLQLLEHSHALRRIHARPSIVQHSNNEGELMDERASRLAASIKAITAEVKSDPSWEGASSTQLESVELTVERAVFARLYLHVLFPNGDGDIGRDHMLRENIARVGMLSAQAVGIAHQHMWAMPFTRAQNMLRRMAVARTPRDKLACIMRCVRSILSVLGLSEGSEPSADDITPVLVFVILRVNPPCLLSTIELVDALGGPLLQGETLYWWTHFCAAVAYIKTMV